MKNFDFAGKFKYMLMAPAALLLIAIVCYFIFGGLNWGIDFTGGVLVTVNLGTSDYETAEINSVIDEIGIKDYTVVKSGDQADIRFPYIESESDENTIREQLTEKLEANEKFSGVKITAWDTVGAVVGSELRKSAIISVAIATVLMLVYIWIRFELASGIVAVLALMHDVLMMFAIVCIFQVKLNSPFVAALLTIVGYSINNTIVIFDRVRENKAYGTRRDYGYDYVVNTSVSASLTRSINTSITTLITIVLLYVFGVSSIKEFALPIIAGLICGTFSSVFLAAPAWGMFMKAHARRKGILPRAAAEPAAAAASAAEETAAAAEKTAKAAVKNTAKKAQVKYSRRPVNKKKGPQQKQS